MDIKIGQLVVALNCEIVGGKIRIDTWQGTVISFDDDWAVIQRPGLFVNSVEIVSREQLFKSTVQVYRSITNMKRFEE